MATGYTASVQSGEVTELDDFVMSCARAMGACIMQRDDNPNDPPKLEEPSDHYDKRLAELEAEKAKLTTMTWEEVVKQFHQDKLDSTKRCHEAIDEKKRYEQLYRAMLTKVHAWMPPSDDHVNFKEFMVEQLTSSIDFDCSVDYYMDQLNDMASETPEDWFEARKAENERSLEYYTKARQEKIDRVEERNRWKTQLFESLGKEIA